MNSGKISKFRTGREKVYFILVVLVSLLFWGGIVFAVVSELATSASPALQEEECIARVADEDGISYVVRKSGDEVSSEDQCLLPSDLTPEETAQLESYDSIVSSLSGVSGFTRIASALSIPFFVIFYLLLGVWMHLLSLAYIRMNAVKLGPNQFSGMYGMVQNLSQQMGLKQTPDAFVLYGSGIVNAFATRLVFRKIIVFSSELAETLTEENDQSQLSAVIAHELGHHVLDHTGFYNWFLIGEFMPLLGTALSRAREYSADRVMKGFVRDQNVCERALIKLTAGKRLGQSANIDAFVDQRKSEGGFFAWLSERLATHPHLPNRIDTLRNFSGDK